MANRTRAEARKRRQYRIRKKVRGSAERPRMAVSISNKHIYVQFIDDDKAVTIASASTIKGKGVKNLNATKEVGKAAAEAASAKGISQVIFDRGGSSYEGRVKALADAAREGGIQF